MKLQILQENLKKSVNLASHFISNRNQLPILNNILLQATKSKLILSATNLENSVSIKLPCKVEKVGEIAINGKTLLDLLLNTQSGNLNLEVIKEQIKITSTNFKATILGTNTSDFPKLPKFTDENSITLKREDLLNSLLKLLFSVSADESRPLLTGVLFRFEKEELKLVSTDSFRLTEIKLKNDIKNTNFDVVIPKNILNEIVRIEDDSPIVLNYDLENKQVFFEIGDTVFSSRIIEGNFPDYQKIIPKTKELGFFVDKEDFARAVRLASVFARDNGNIVKLIIQKSKIKITAEGSNTGSQESETDIRTDDDKETEIVFNYRYLEEMLKSIENDEVEVIVSSQNTACKFMDPKNPNFLHLIMPIKI